MKKLLVFGAQLRKRRCQRSAADDKYAAQHENVWILDSEIMLLTTMNATRNSVLNCEGSGVFLRTERETREQELHFDELFAGAEVIKLQDLPGETRP